MSPPPEQACALSTLDGKPVFPWRRGDVLAIDNFAVSHGRLPDSGPREIAVAWA